MSTPIKVALDSDMLRNFAFFYFLTKDGKVYKYRPIENVHVKQHFEDYNYLLSCAKCGKIEFHIGKSVYFENKHSEKLMEFAKMYCHCLFNNDSNKIEKLANAYCNTYSYNGQKLLAPMDKQFVAAINKEVPSNDCYIMAQATVDSCYLLTNNLQHFIYDRFSNDINDHRRVDGIKQINIQHGFRKKLENGKEFVPQPIVIKKLVKMLEAIHNTSKHNNLIVKTTDKLDIDSIEV